ncbi:SH3 domain-containing protein [Hazenella sp. IB182353]|uniref:SH3 domain-containing protein n=1 Tax=Polycladospora coralii TaxID=2771432 RepID=UPI001745DC1A|nr:SH3 domain-containing protein [Polycladospora coralii]MBS7531712.1 SH3 domain-containing protein [Polycladospora coralii]
MMRNISIAFLAFLLSFMTIFASPPTIEAASSTYQIEINKNTNKLYLYYNGKVQKVYPVATGRSNSLTPEGTFSIVVKISKPGWKGIPGGRADNPLGDWWLGLSVNGDKGRTYGIHGTNNPSSIGKHASSGCVRMHNSHVNELRKRVKEGTPVWIHSGTSNNRWRGNTSSGVKAASGTVQITGSRVNIRSGPSLGAFIITQAKKGQKFTRTGKAGIWHRIKLSNGRTAYVHGDYARVVSGGDSFRSTSGTVAISVRVANIRSGPSLSSSIIGKGRSGNTYTLTGDNGSWYRIKLNNRKTAYLHHSVARKKSTTSSNGTIQVNVSLANIRSAPSLSATILQRVPRGMVLNKVGTSGQFYQIRLRSGKIAYIHKSIVR